MSTSTLTRRQVLKGGAAGMATLVIGSQLDWVFENKAFAAVQTQTINFHITDALKDMHTHNAINAAQCYYWIFKDDRFPAECPGPTIVATQGDNINLTITNDLDEPHSMFIQGMFNSRPIAPGQTVTKRFRAGRPGTYLYFDNLNAPVNRVMGLHGCLIVMPRARRINPRRRPTPYSAPGAAIQRMYNEFGNSPHWPGLAWDQGDVATGTPPFRQYVWLCHESSPNLHQEVGSLAPGVEMPAAEFVNRWVNDPFSPVRANAKPQYFTINGQSGHFSHNNSTITPMNRVGEPSLVRVLNAGLMTHSMHIHANHVYVTSVNGRVQTNPLWVDTFTLNPMDTFDYTVPFMRPPDIPNARGLGQPDAGQPTLAGGSTYPPLEELDVFMPPVGTTAGVFDIAERQSPLCYPMHDHSEPSQTSQGGNYNTGLISGIYFIGDRNTPGQMNFPLEPDFAMMLEGGVGTQATSAAAGPEVMPPV